MPPDFVQKKAGYAILPENGRELTADTLFPFWQVTLAHAARIRRSAIEVEVTGIPITGGRDHHGHRGHRPRRLESRRWSSPLSRTKVLMLHLAIHD